MMPLLQVEAPTWFSLDAAAVPDVAGAFLICFLTLAIFSFLYRDNPCYKLAEHLFIGVGTAWYTMEFYESGVLGPLVHYFQDTSARTAAGQETIAVGGYPVALGWAVAWRLVAVALSLMLLVRLLRRDAWISRWPLALMVGIYAALKMTGETQAKLVQQIKETMVPVWTSETSAVEVAGNLVLVLGLVCVLVHFLFTVRRGRVMAGFSRAGVIVLMLAFGARFGFAVLGRIALLIERVSELASYGTPTYALGGGSAWLSPPWLVGGLIVLLLALGALSRRGRPQEPAA